MTAGSPNWRAPSVGFDSITASPYRADLEGGRAYAWRVASHDETLDDLNPLAGTTVSFSTPATFSTRGGAQEPS